MSQQKIDKYKQEKYNRKKTPKKSKLKSIVAYIIGVVVAIAILIYLGYSIAVTTGLYTPPETTTAYQSSISTEDLRKKLIENGDKNVKGNTSTEETTTVEATTAE